MIIYNDKTFNKHFAEIVKALNIFEWPSNNKDLLNDQFTAFITKFRNLPSILKIKSKYNFQEKIYFTPFAVKFVENIIKIFLTIKRLEEK